MVLLIPLISGDLRTCLCVGENVSGRLLFLSVCVYKCLRAQVFLISVPFPNHLLVIIQKACSHTHIYTHRESDSSHKHTLTHSHLRELAELKTGHAQWDSAVILGRFSAERESERGLVCIQTRRLQESKYKVKFELTLFDNRDV